MSDDFSWIAFTSNQVCTCRFFLKEGVVHAMEQLAATAPKEEPEPEPKPEPAPKSRAPTLRRSSSRLKVSLHLSIFFSLLP